MPYDETDFMAEDDLRALEQAAAVRRDSGRMKRARAKADEKRRALDDAMQTPRRDREDLQEGFRRV